MNKPAALMLGLFLISISIVHWHSVKASYIQFREWAINGGKVGFAVFILACWLAVLLVCGLWGVL